ncbi:MAG: hypothetical protein H6833_06885 [Planctomycetes bacterium]|nr:hypothetical protein [Planctomycetota bacterium]
MSRFARIRATSRELVVHTSLIVGAIVLVGIACAILDSTLRDAYAIRSYRRISAQGEVVATYVALSIGGLLAGSLAVVGLYRLWSRGRARWAIPTTLLLYGPLLLVATACTYVLGMAIGWV